MFLKSVLLIVDLVQQSSLGTGTLLRFLYKQTSGVLRRAYYLPTEPRTTLPDGPASLSIESLCDSCKWALQHAPTTSRGQRSGRRTVSVAKLTSGVAMGCWSCSIIFNATTRFWNVTKEELEKMVQFWVRYDTEAFTVHGQNHLPTIQIHTLQGYPQVGRFVPASNIASNGDSPDLLEFIKLRLAECLADHRSCRKYQAFMFEALGVGFPRRILEIDARGQRVKLIDFQTMKSRDYSALSYCWGSNKTTTPKPLRATRDTVPGLRKGIKISELPATLQDAVKVSTTIGISYIWIDSICIIQDDNEDWTTEAAKMSTVYSNAMLTIIAGSADTCHRGFLTQAREQSACVGRVRTGDGQDAVVYGRKLRDWGYHRNGAQGPHLGKDQWLDPVDSRGWILQERLLSTRYINFTTGEAQWGCQEANECECGQPATPDFLAASAEDQWHAIVKEFTRRDLSKRSDVLVAIAGIARKYANLLDRNDWEWYAAGIWLSPQLNALTARSLLWYRWSRNPPAHFPTEHLGPSFSWASIVGEVTPANQIPGEGVLYPTTVTRISMQPSTSKNEFGQINGGKIDLRGPLLAAKMSLAVPGTHISDRDATLQLMDAPHVAVTSVYPDGVLEKAAFDNEEGGSSTVCRRKTGRLEESERLRQGVSFVDADVFLLPITADVRNLLQPGRLDHEPRGEALILARSLAGPGYERVAVASYRMFQGDWSNFPVQDVSLY